MVTQPDQSLKVLLAEDNDGDIYIIKEALNLHLILYDLRLVRDGDEAQQYFREVGAEVVPCPHIFLLDLNIPKASGHEVLSTFRQFCGETPVVVITSSDSPVDRLQANQAGVSRYFRKPSDLDEFFQLGKLVKELIN